MARLKTSTDPGATCPDGELHLWDAAPVHLAALYLEPVAYTCRRCAIAVGPRYVSRIQSANQNRGDRNALLGKLFEAIGGELAAAAEAIEKADAETHSSHIAKACALAQRGATVLKGEASS